MFNAYTYYYIYIHLLCLSYLFDTFIHYICLLLRRLRLGTAAPVSLGPQEGFTNGLSDAQLRENENYKMASGCDVGANMAPFRFPRSTKITSWGHLGASCGRLGASWAGRAILKHLDAVWGPQTSSCSQKWPSLRRHGAVLGRLEAVFGRQRAVLGRL